MVDGVSWRNLLDHYPGVAFDVLYTHPMFKSLIIRRHERLLPAGVTYRFSFWESAILAALLGVFVGSVPDTPLLAAYASSAVLYLVLSNLKNREPFSRGMGSSESSDQTPLMFDDPDNPLQRNLSGSRVNPSFYDNVRMDNCDD